MLLLQPQGARRYAVDVDDDAELIEHAIMRAKRGDPGGLGDIYGICQPKVYAFLRHMIRDEHQAEDLTQEVFIKLMATIDQYERGDVPFLAWLLCVARNVAIDDLRRRRPIPWGEVGPGSVERGEPDWLRPSSFREAVALLHREQRSVLVLRHVLGLSPREIAKLLGKSESSVHALH
ncbi:MAG: RNA polymerase sigma factor, partial [Vicinamibacterales bacterium]